MSWHQLKEGQKPLEELEVDDKIMVSERHGYSLRYVERVTKTQIILNGGISKYRKSDGRCIGAGVWDSNRISHATPEMIEELKAARAHQVLIGEVRGLLASANARHYSVKKLQAIKDALEAEDDGK